MDELRPSFLDNVRSARDSIKKAMGGGQSAVRVCLSTLWGSRFEGLAEVEASGLFLSPPIHAARLYGVPVEDSAQVNVAEVHFADGTFVTVDLVRP